MLLNAKARFHRNIGEGAIAVVLLIRQIPGCSVGGGEIVDTGEEDIEVTVLAKVRHRAIGVSGSEKG